MFEDLLSSHEQLGNMLTDLQEHYGDFHPDDVAEMLSECERKAMALAREILAQRRYVSDLSRDWVTTQSGLDAGMPPGVLHQGIGDDGRGVS